MKIPTSPLPETKPGETLNEFLERAIQLSHEYNLQYTDADNEYAARWYRGYHAAMNSVKDFLENSYVTVRRADRVVTYED